MSSRNLVSSGPFQVLVFAAWMAAGSVSSLAGVTVRGTEPAEGGDGNDAHFHHVQLNVTDPGRSRSFYEELFGAVPVEVAGVTPGVWVERSLILFQQVEEEADAALESAIWHIGWGGTDGPAEFRWFQEKGARFETELTELGSNHFFYLYGPDEEVIEVFTGEQNHRFNHVHLLASDVDAMSAWFAEHLGLEPRRAPPARPFLLGGEPTLANSFRVDNVGILIFGSPTPEEPQSWIPEAVDLTGLKPTRGRVVDHIGFSFRDIDPVYRRMQAAGARLEGPISFDAGLGTRGFFAVAPDGLRLQIVERDPFPQGLWE